MARITYTYQYRSYPDCPLATSLSRFFCSPKKGAYTGMGLGMLLILIGCLIYNGSGHQTNLFNVFFLILGFAFFLGGSFLVPWLFRLLKISDRVCARQMKKKM